MEIKEQKTKGKFQKEFKVTIPPSDMTARIEARLKVVGKDVKLDGFRPGKVPMPVLKKRFGERVRGEVLQQAVNDTSSKVLQEKKIRPALQPEISVDEFGDDNTLTYTVKVTAMPKVEDVDFSKIEVKKPVADVKAKDVDDALQRIAESNKTTEPMKSKREVKEGDIVIIDFDGSVDGESLPGMKAEDYELEIGSGAFIDNFEDQLVGAKPGDEVEVKVTFPDDYHGEQVAGKEAIFKVTLKSLCKSVVPDIDDELAAKVGMEGLDDLKENVKERIQSEFDQMSRERAKRNLLDALDEAYKFELPPKMVEEEFEQIWQSHLEDLKQRDLDVEAAKKDKEMRKEFEEIAERRVRLGIILSDAGEKANVRVTPQELNQALQREAYRYPGREQEVFQYYQQNPQAVQALRAPLFENKVVDHILDQVKVKETKVDADKLAEDPDADKEGKRVKTAAKSKKSKKKSGSSKKKSA